MQVKYFSGTEEVKFRGFTLDNARFARAFPAIKGVRSDGYCKLVGYTVGEAQAMVPITRVIYRKAHPSNHPCDARRRNAKGRNCECSCGGPFHEQGAEAEWIRERANFQIEPPRGWRDAKGLFVSNLQMMAR